MKNHIKICNLILALGLSSCVNVSQDELNPSRPQTIESNSSQTKMSIKQAMLYADMLANLNDGESTLQESRTASSERNVSQIQYYVEDGDTVLYLFNYGHDQGFLLLAGDNGSNPILAHSKEGSLDMNGLKDDSYLKEFIKSNARRIKSEMYDSSRVNCDYYADWADLGKDGYEYVIEEACGEPSAHPTRGSSRRKFSSGKASIYPYTGKDLDYWCQMGGYNMSAPNQACIGCPAIAIGMLLYDVSERLTGNSVSTLPAFYYSDKADIKDLSYESPLSIRLKEIADCIPNYQWGNHQGALSGATPSDIQTGLRNLGFINAALVGYDFETLYQQMTFKGIDYFGESRSYDRGILLGASHTNPYGGGHIWFCDGYYEQSYKVTKKFLGIKVDSWTEYDDRLYMNWGWGKEAGNGWYAASESVWTTWEGDQKDVYFKRNPQMFINLAEYVYPY